MECLVIRSNPRRRKCVYCDTDSSPIGRARPFDRPLLASSSVCLAYIGYYSYLREKVRRELGSPWPSKPRRPFYPSRKGSKVERAQGRDIMPLLKGFIKAD